MKKRLLQIAMLVAYAYCNTIPTQDTLVVAKSDETTSLPDSDVTTEEPNAPIKMTDMLVHSEISLRYAHTFVVTHVRNPSRKSQQTTFHVLLPDTAFISGFIMTMGGKSYKAYVKEKQEAKKIYNDAVSQGIGAAHIAAKARDSNHFTVTVNVEPNSKVTFNLTYEELLVRRIGVYNHVINLHPGAVVPRMEVTVHIKEYQKIKLLRVPEVRTGNEIDATENDTLNSGAVIQRSADKKEATITFTPDLEEQKRLIRIYADKTKKSLSSSYNRYMAQEEQEDNKEGTIGQFVVQYDVERSDNGEVILNDGYFVHFFAPQSLPALSKYVVFVLDTSGSMSGRKIKQLQDAMKAILADLNPTDYFTIIEFNSDVTVHKLKEADEEPAPRYYTWHRESKPVEIVPPSIASPDNIAKAQVIVSRLIATGGTNIYDALKVATDHVHKANYEEKRENETTTEVSNMTSETSTDSASDLEPIIIFLTDGDPTVGETSTSRIISHMSENNSGEKKASLYCLAFGEDADRTFLRKLALRNEGFMRHIYEAADAELQLRDFYRQVSSPLLSKIRFVYPPEQIKEGSITRHKYNTIYDGGEVIVAGELAPGSNDLASTVEAFCANPDRHGRKRYEIKTAGSPVRAGEYLPLERLWAYLTIKQLLDEREMAEKAEDIDKRALAIALKYSFVTPLTSLVVVKPNATNAVNAESVDDNNQNVMPSFSGSYLMARPPSFQMVANWPRSDLRFGSADAGWGGGWNTGAANLYPTVFGAPGVPAPAYQFESARPLSLNAVGDDLQLEEEYVENTDDASRLLAPPSFIQHRYKPVALSAIPDRILGASYKQYAGITINDDFDDIDSSSYSLTPTSSRPIFSTTILSTTLLPSEEEYHLRSYGWALSLLNKDAGTLEFSAGGKNVSLELSKELVPPRASTDEECANSLNASGDAQGLCVYLTRCTAAVNIEVDVYRTTYCYVNDKYAGVCCPRNHVDSKTA